mgnify:CR=1 FL=1
MKKLSVILCASSIVYTLWYMHFDLPWTNDGALSTIGLTHRTYFIIWGVLTFAALSLSVITAYRERTKTKIYIPLLTLSGIGMALTLIFRFDYDIKPNYYFHCAGSLTFSIVTGVTIFLLFVLAKDRLFAVITAVILIADTVLLIIFKENGLIEAVPIFAGYIMLCITNLRRDKIEITR